MGLLFSSPTVVSAADKGGIVFDSFQTIAGPVQGEQGTVLAVDATGNLFTGGSHAGLDTDGDGRVDRPANGVDPMWVKSSANGTPQWIATATAPGHHTAGQIIPDGAGGLYAVGSIHADQLVLGDRKIIRNTGVRDGYLLHLSDAGRLLWTRTATGAGGQHFTDVTRDSAGNVYVIGHADGPTSLEAQRSASPRGVSSSVFLSAWDKEGNGIGTVYWSIDQGEWQFTHLVVDQADRIWVVGSATSGALDLDRDGTPETWE